MTKYLPVHKDTKQPLWIESAEGFVIKAGNAKIIVSKPPAKGKSLTITLENGPTYTLKKANWPKITDCCRFLALLKKRAGEAKIREITIDTPDKGRFFTSEPGKGFVWLTDKDNQILA